MGRAGRLLVDGTAEEHLRIGALEDAGDAGAPLELLLDDCFFFSAQRENYAVNYFCSRRRGPDASDGRVCAYPQRPALRREHGGRRPGFNHPEQGRRPRRIWCVASPQQLMRLPDSTHRQPRHSTMHPSIPRPPASSSRAQATTSRSSLPRGRAVP